jgi:hypothetical protein
VMQVYWSMLSDLLTDDSPDPAVAKFPEFCTRETHS